MNIWDAIKSGNASWVEKNVASDDVEDRDILGWTPLMRACYGGDINIVRNLVDLGSNIEFKDEDGLTSLMIASSQGHTEIVRFLVEKGANIESKDLEKFTPVMWASIYGRLDTLSFLMESGANLEGKCLDGNGLFHFAVQNGEFEIAECLASSIIPNLSYENADISALFSRNGDAGRLRHGSLVKALIPLYIMRATKDSEFAQKMEYDIAEMLRGKIDEEADPLTEKETRLLSTLQKALGFVKSLDPQDRLAIDALLNSDYDDNNESQKEDKEKSDNKNCSVDKNKENETSEKEKFNVEKNLIQAIEDGHFELAETLFDEGIDINNIDEIQKEMIISFAVESENPEMVSLLIRHGVDIGYIVKEIIKIHHHCTRICSPLILRSLIDHGMNVDIENEMGQTLLMSAAYIGDVESVRILIDAHSNVNKRDSDDKTPTMYLVSGMGSEEDKKVILKFFIDSGADIDTSSPDRASPLAICVFCDKHTEIIKHLLELGVSPNGSSGDVVRPLTLALAMGRDDVATMLLDAGADLKLCDDFSSHQKSRTWYHARHFSQNGEFSLHTPLMNAALNNNIGMIKKLLNAGANIDAKTPYGETVFELDTLPNKARKTLLAWKNEHCVGKQNEADANVYR